jgi:hypothetical protein
MSTRTSRREGKRREAMGAIGFYAGVTIMFLPVVGMITGLVAVVLGLATPLSAVVATVIVTLQMLAMDRGYGGGPLWKVLGTVAYLPFRIAAEVVGRAAAFPVLDRAVMFVGATISFWWPAVVLASWERLC